MKPPNYSVRKFGALQDATEISLVTLGNGRGVELDIINYGATISRLVTPDRLGHRENIVLGLATLEDYIASNAYFGSVVGRYANRISNGRLSIEGVDYQLPKNEGQHHLHGGPQGFNKRAWAMTPFRNKDSTGVTLELTSHDGDQGYPGTLRVKLTVTLTQNSELDLQFDATTDKTTVANLTHHSYFNLAGSGSILDHELKLCADHFSPVTRELIPKGDIQPVKGTPFDFREFKTVGKHITNDDQQLMHAKGYDHNFVVNNQNGCNNLVATLREPKYGRMLHIKSTLPGLQLYSGNFLNGREGNQSQRHGYRTGLCIEPQYFPDSPNIHHFPSTLVTPSNPYKARITYQFTTYIC